MFILFLSIWKTAYINKTPLAAAPCPPERLPHLEQLVGLKLLGAEDDAVSVAPHPDGLAALPQEHHVLPVLAVEAVGRARH